MAAPVPVAEYLRSTSRSRHITESYSRVKQPTWTDVLDPIALEKGIPAIHKIIASQNQNKRLVHWHDRFSRIEKSTYHFQVLDRQTQADPVVAGPCTWLPPVG